MMGEKCPECGGKVVVDPRNGEVVCSSCGLVIEESTLDPGPEWRSYSLDEKASRSRVGPPLLLQRHNKGLPTVIGRFDVDSHGRRLQSSSRSRMWRLRRLDEKVRVNPPFGRNLSEAMADLALLSDAASIPLPVREEAAAIYRKALGRGLVRGRTIRGMVAASVYAACRLTGTPRRLSEVSELAGLERKDVARCYRLLLRELDIKMPMTNPLPYLAKIAERCDVSGEAQILAVKILREAKRRGVSFGRDPTGLAAAALYIACLEKGEPATQKDISNAAGITEVTLRNVYKTLERSLGLKLNRRTGGRPPQLEASPKFNSKIDAGSALMEA